MFIQEEVEVKWVPYTKGYYVEKGYVFTKMFDTFTVKLEDLAENSNARVLVKCDRCNEEVGYKTYSTVKKAIKSKGEYVCSNCSYKRGKHKGTGTRLHNIWNNMRYRCSNPNIKYWENYGGRGIKVCPEWEKDFNSFKEWSLANGYTDKLSIDRIDNDGNYEPSNCRWATKIEQDRNKRSNHLVTIKGETKTIAEWAEIVGIDHSSFWRRVDKGWSEEELLISKEDSHRKKYEKGVSEETRKKQSEAHKGQTLSEEARKKLSASLKGKKRREIPKEIEAEIIIALRAGASVNSLYKKYDLGRVAIYEIRDREKIPPTIKRVAPNKKEISTQIKTKIIEELNNGSSVSSLHKKYGLSYWSVSKIDKEREAAE